MADAGSCTPAKLQLRHPASFCSCSLSGPTIPRKSACASSGNNFTAGFSSSHFGSDFDILACMVIQIGWALEKKYLDLDGSIGPRAGFEWAVSYTLVKSIVLCIV